MSREVCGICWCPYDEDTGECACVPEPKAQHMTTLREAAQQALEALELAKLNGKAGLYPAEVEEITDAITALKAALAKPVQEQDIEDAIEAAYWHFDARKKGLNEWASAPQSERDAFKAEARKLSKGYFPTRQAQDTKREMLAVADAFIRGKRAALAEPVQEPVAWRWGYRSITTGEMDWRGYVEIAADTNLRSPEIIMQPLYTAPPQRKPLTEEEIYSLFRTSGSPTAFARAIEQAHGIT